MCGKCNLALFEVHALREEGDPSTIGRCRTWCNFNPRPPRGGRHHILYFRYCSFYFNPRPPRGGRREYFSLSFRVSMNFNPRPPRGGRRKKYLLSFRRNNFNPRPPRGGRLSTAVAFVHQTRFQSTPSARRATYRTSLKSSRKNFNPRPPRGGRHSFSLLSKCFGNFNPRPPRGGRLSEGLCDHLYLYISIHALREEGDKP